MIDLHTPENWVSWGTLIFVAALCLIISAFVSGSEIAYFGLTATDIEDLREEESRQAKNACFLLHNSERLLATILISNNLVNITMVVVLSYAINQVASFNNSVVDFLLQTVLLTFLLLLFGEIFPNLMARSRTVKWVKFAS